MDCVLSRATTDKPAYSTLDTDIPRISMLASMNPLNMFQFYRDYVIDITHSDDR